MYIFKQASYGIFIYDKVNYLNRFAYNKDMCICFSFQSDFGELDSYKNWQTINAAFMSIKKEIFLWNLSFFPLFLALTFAQNLKWQI